MFLYVIFKICCQILGLCSQNPTVAPPLDPALKHPYECVKFQIDICDGYDFTCGQISDLPINFCNDFANVLL